MLDLKPYFDAVNEAEAEVQLIANELDVLFREGTDESKVKALELQPSLDRALAKHDEVVKLYEAMQLANRPNDTARNFVPVSTTVIDGDGSQPSIIKRQDYDRLSLQDRAKFIVSGGTLED